MRSIVTAVAPICRFRAEGQRFGNSETGFPPGQGSPQLLHDVAQTATSCATGQLSDGGLEFRYALAGNLDPRAITVDEKEPRRKGRSTRTRRAGDLRPAGCTRYLGS